MTYEDVFENFYIEMTDSKFYENKKYAYECMSMWLHKAAALPYVKEAFKVLILDDDFQEITYELKHPTDDLLDDDFIMKIFTDYMIICWMKPRVNTAVNFSTVIGDKETKRLISNYSTNMAQMKACELAHVKLLSNYNYMHNDYLDDGGN